MRKKSSCAIYVAQSASFCNRIIKWVLQPGASLECWHLAVWCITSPACDNPRLHSGSGEASFEMQFWRLVFFFHLWNLGKMADQVAVAERISTFKRKIIISGPLVMAISVLASVNSTSRHCWFALICMMIRSGSGVKRQCIHKSSLHIVQVANYLCPNFFEITRYEWFLLACKSNRGKLGRHV